MSKRFNPAILLILFVLILANSSCISNKKLLYLQQLDTKADTLFSMQRAKYRLQANDIVQIQIKIPFASPEVNNAFEINSSSSNMMRQIGEGDFYYIFGYSLNDSGFVDLPLLGKVKLIGKSLEECSEIIKIELEKSFKEPYVVVRIGGLRFSVLGEANRPGKYVIMQNQLTIFEALAAAGDLRVIAKRDKINLLRQYPEGSRLHTLNLLDRNIVSSPYYFIQPNDIIYIEPMKIRALGTGETLIPTITSVIGALSSTLLIINLLTR
jgi:polysaccharide export outer membrane protein